MSLAPMVHPAIRGVEGKRHPVSTHCVVPGCISLAQHAHHLWPRSYLRGQPTEWVSLPSGRIVSNLVGLCVRHHNQVTGEIGGHKAMIKLEDDETFIWLDKQEDGWLWAGAINPQPFSSSPEEAPKVTRKQAHLHLDPGQTCGSCGYTMPRKQKPGPKRKVSSWAVKVPDDGEIGAEVLDEWIEAIARRAGLAGDVGVGLTRYHALCLMMGYYYQTEDDFLAMLTEAAEA